MSEFLVIRLKKLLGVVHADSLTVARAKAYALYGAGCWVELGTTKEDAQREQYHGT